MMRITPLWTEQNPAMQQSSLQNPEKGRLHIEFISATADIKITQKLLYMAPLGTSPRHCLSGHAIAVTSPGCWWFTGTHFTHQLFNTAMQKFTLHSRNVFKERGIIFLLYKQERIMGYIPRFSCDDQQ